MLATLMLVVSANATAQQIQAVGTSRVFDTAIKNSYLSAHFKCNRKGLWANLDQLQIVNTTRSTVAVPGSKRRIAFYEVEVTTTCTTEFQMAPNLDK